MWFNCVHHRRFRTPVVSVTIFLTVGCGGTVHAKTLLLNGNVTSGKEQPQKETKQCKEINARVETPTMVKVVKGNACITEQRFRGGVHVIIMEKETVEETTFKPPLVVAEKSFHGT